MDRKSKKSEKKIAQGLITFFLILAVSVIAAHAVFRRSPLNSFIMISLEVMALVFMGFILLVWMRIFLLTIIARRKFALTLEYPVDISGSEKISIIVPARNEERNIRRCLQSLRKIEYPNVEIIVVNDRSTDRTAQIIAEFAKLDSRVKLIQGKDFKDGWSGKIHAIHQGVLNACGDWFLFIDADVAIHEKAPAIALSYCLRNELKVLSTSLRPSLESFWENIIMPVVFIAIGFSSPPERVNDPDDEAALANGGFIFVNAKSYRAIGGFEAIKDAIQEDVAFARLAKSKKVPYRFMRGQEMGTQRWYTSFRQ
ncbi:MAG: glycosyltransferase, partial [Candidatus Hydrothermarchaeota archaeon]